MRHKSDTSVLHAVSPQVAADELADSFERQRHWNLFWIAFGITLTCFALAAFAANIHFPRLPIMTQWQQDREDVADWHRRGLPGEPTMHELQQRDFYRRFGR
jgi:hypothetical protein